MVAQRKNHPVIDRRIEGSRSELTTAGNGTGTEATGLKVDPISAFGRMMLDQSAATCITDRRGELIYANPAYEKIAEAVAMADLAPIGRPIERTTQPRDARQSKQTPATTRSANPLARHAITVSGVTEYYSLREVLLPGPEQDLIARATIFVPAAEHDGTKAKLAATIERFEDITRLVSDWVWESDRDLMLTFVSPRVNEALGYHPAQLTGRPLAGIFATPVQGIDALTSEDGRRPFRDMSAQIVHRDGTIRHVLLSGLPVYCPETGSFLGYRGTANDVSELRWRESAILRAKEDAELANRSKTEFLATMSHELRTPLNAIIGFADIMGSEMLGPLGNAQYKGYTHDIVDSARHLLNLINDILDTSKIEAGHMSLTEELIDPHELAKSVCRLVAPRAERANLDFEVRIADGIPALRADKTKLKQILINLLSNAIKFTPKSGHITFAAEVTPERDFLFVISDSGIGIAPEDIARAMAPFGQVDAQLNRKFEGTGLGLPLAKCLTELHGGTFELTSEPSVGTTVTVRLPASRVVQR